MVGNIYLSNLRKITPASFGLLFGKMDSCQRRTTTSTVLLSFFACFSCFAIIANSSAFPWLFGLYQASLIRQGQCFFFCSTIVSRSFARASAHDTCLALFFGLNVPNDNPAVLIMTFKAFIFSKRREKQGLKQHISPFFHSIQHKIILRSLIMRIADDNHDTLQLCRYDVPKFFLVFHSVQFAALNEALCLH